MIHENKIMLAKPKKIFTILLEEQMIVMLKVVWKTAKRSWSLICVNI